MLRRAVATLCAGLMATTPAFACTDVRLIAGDGSATTVRTMEFAMELGSEVQIIPRGLQVTSPAPQRQRFEVDLEVRLRGHERLRHAGRHRRAEREGPRLRRPLSAGRNQIPGHQAGRGKPRAVQRRLRRLGPRQLRYRRRGQGGGCRHRRVGRDGAAARLVLAAALRRARPQRQKHRHRVRRRQDARLRQRGRRAHQLADLRVAHPEPAQLREPDGRQRQAGEDRQRDVRRHRDRARACMACPAIRRLLRVSSWRRRRPTSPTSRRMPPRR